jgi:hypothetical protein
VHPVQDALHYDVTVVPIDTSGHVLMEVETQWRLRSKDLVTMELDSNMRVIRVLVDGVPESRVSRTMYARTSETVEVPHQKPVGDTLTTRVRYRG